MTAASSSQVRPELADHHLRRDTVYTAVATPVIEDLTTLPVPLAVECSDGQVQATAVAPWTTLSHSVSSIGTSVETLGNQAASTSLPMLSVLQAFRTTIAPKSLTSLTTSAVQSVEAPIPPDTTGSVHSTLETKGNPASQPFLTASLAKTASLSLVDISTLTGAKPTYIIDATSLQVDNIFKPIATDAPPPQIPLRSDYPVPPLGIAPQNQRLETNKFYANLFLGDQASAVWNHPYSLSWSKGMGETNSWGMAVSHIEREQLATAPATSSDAGQWAYFINPIGVQSLVLSANELKNGTTLTTDHLEALSVNANLNAPGSSLPTIVFPLVHGMGFVTGIYNNATPLLQSGIGIQSLTYAGAVLKESTYKYSVLLENGFTWLIYITPHSSAYPQNAFTLVSSVSIQGAPGFSGLIQVAKIPAGAPSAQSIYDNSCGVYAHSVSVKGSVHGVKGAYTLSWTRWGAGHKSLLMFALPHHVSSFSPQTSAGITSMQLMTTTKGLATAVHGDHWTLIEPELPIDMAFSPWSPTQGSINGVPSKAAQQINAAGAIELAENIAQQTNTGSIYYDGKALAKFAAIVYAVHEFADNSTLALTGLVKLEAAFALHVANEQLASLVYDTVWGGAVALSTYLTGNSGDDFGNTYYNDHQFHYGYFLYAAAVIGYLDPPWLSNGTNKAWVNMLARDFANSITNDPYFPFTRSFDWYNGHSWAKGLFESADGKDEESSSEDTMASYGIKMWGRTIGDKNMEARGNLMLAIQARSLSDYFLYLNENTVEPAQFIGNEVSGILFENKIDHTTYFGNQIEYIEGIHMLPLMPMSTLIRSPTFVQQEWTAYNFGAYVQQVQGGWRGILMANLAIIDPVTSYDFFSNATGQFSMSMLDGGASQTWYLAWSAALGGGR